LHQSNIDTSIPSLLKALEHRNSLVRDSAISILAKTKDKTIIPNLKKALNDKNLVVRCKVAEVLKKIGDPSGLQTVIDCTKNNNRNVRIVAVKTLSEFKENKKIIPVFTNLLGDKDKFVRMIAIEQLEIFKPLVVMILKKLVDLLSDESPEVRYEANVALEKITHKKLGFSHVAPENERKRMIKQWASTVKSLNV